MTICSAIAAFSVCQGLRRRLEGLEERALLQGRVELTRLYNTGAAFSLPIGQWAAQALTPVALALAWRLRRRSPLGAGLVLGGGLSNLYERRHRGAVLDYLSIPKVPLAGRYVYNAADLLIFAGCALLAASGDEGDAHR